MNRRNFLKSITALSAAGLGFRRWQIDPQQFFIPPTVQHVTENGAVIYFRLGTPAANGLLQIARAGVVEQEIPFSAVDNLRQQIFVEDLEPGATYEYQVLVDDVVPPVLGLEEAWDQLTFKTPPYEFPLRVAAVGDSGFGDDMTIQLAQMMAEHDPDLFFHLGDVVYWLHEYDNDHYLNWALKYFKPFKPLLQRIPHYPTIGNHEFDGPAQLDGWASYYWMFPTFNTDQNAAGMRSWYSFEHNGIQFLSLNSQLFYSYAEYRAPQEAWLEEKLARTDVLYTVVFFHVSPFTASAPHQWDGIYLAEKWVPKFEASNVALVISGHAHVYERAEQNGIHYIVAGGGSSTIYGRGDNIPQSENLWTISSFPIFDFYEDRIHLTAYAHTGEIIDDLDLPLRGSGN